MNTIPSNVPPKIPIFYIEFDYYLSSTIKLLSSHFLKNFEAMRATFLPLFAPQHLSSSAKYHLNVRGKKKYSLGGQRVEQVAQAGFGVSVLGNLLWLTVLWAGRLDKMISRSLFHLQVFCDCLDFGSPNWIMLRNVCQVLKSRWFFSLKNTVCNKSVATFA